MIKTYYELTKPGIIYGNLLTAGAGFLFASHGNPEITVLIATLVGIALIIASACVANNIIDRDIDALMERTKHRSLVTGIISPRNGWIFSSVLGIAGFYTLATFTNLLTVLIGVIGYLSYVGVYTFYKRHTSYGTLLGSISGSTSLVAGYCAASNSFDSTALILFLIMAIWQIPHFYAIAIFRIKDYERASIPVMPVVKGIPATQFQTTLYIVAFIASTTLLSIFGHAGIVYLGVMLGLGLWWLRLSIEGIRPLNDEQAAKHVFRFSLIVLLVFSATISLNSVLA
jgi:protoheme IX farnesyltransferase